MSSNDPKSTNVNLLDIRVLTNITKFLDDDIVGNEINDIMEEPPSNDELSPCSSSLTSMNLLSPTKSENFLFQTSSLNQYFYYDDENTICVPPAPYTSPVFPISHHKFVFKEQLHILSPCVRYLSRPIQLKLMEDDVNNSFNSGSFIIEIMEPCLVKLITNQVEYMINSNILSMEEVYGTGNPPLVFSGNIRIYAFFAKVPPRVSISYYINRLVVYSNCSSSAFIVMLVYLERVQRYCPTLTLNSVNCHRLILVALVLAIKYMEDDVYLNSHYAFIGGVSTSELNELELQFLDLIGWNLNVCRDMFDHFRNDLMEHSP